ncbi:uncharacterized protein TNCV_3359571 [Trichonephila clavipes]|nr:uncharacterized protein TNCV_3359571 [Trichonephila clavipes]
MEIQLVEKLKTRKFSVQLDESTLRERETVQITYGKPSKAKTISSVLNEILIFLKNSINAIKANIKCGRLFKLFCQEPNEEHVRLILNFLKSFARLLNVLRKSKERKQIPRADAGEEERFSDHDLRRVATGGAIAAPQLPPLPVENALTRADDIDREWGESRLPLIADYEQLLQSPSIYLVHSPKAGISFSCGAILADTNRRNQAFVAYPHRPMTLHSPTENSLAVLNHKIVEASSQVQNVKLGGHQTCLSINRLWHELCDMLRRLVGTTALGHHDCSIQE